MKVPVYQRAFVWNSRLQSELIESILQGIYIGQILLLAKTEDPGCFDIVDGHQRLESIRKFIEGGFQLGERKLTEEEQQSFFSQSLCICILNDEMSGSDQVQNIFQRINTAGEPLTAQEIRRVNAVGCFADTVNALWPQLRHAPDCGGEGHPLSRMWDHFAVFTEKEKMQGEDQALISRIILSVLFETCQAQDERMLDCAYRGNGALYKRIEDMLETYPASKLVLHLTAVFTALITRTAGTVNCTCECFYIIFLALYERLITQSGKLAAGSSLDAVFRAIDPLIPQRRMTDLEYRSLLEYAGYRIDQNCGGISGEWEMMETILRRAKVETAGCEFKQGLLRLSEGRKEEASLKDQILETLCGMANAHLAEPAYLFIGIADKEADARRIAFLDKIAPVKVADHYLVGIEREAAVMNVSVEEYCRKIKNFIDNSDLSKPLALSVLSNIDVVVCRGFSIVRLTVLPQKEISYFRDKIFIRKHSNTIQVTNPREIVAIAKSFFS